MRVTGRSVRPPPCRHATAVAARQFPSSSEEGSLRPPPKTSDVHGPRLGCRHPRPAGARTQGILMSLLRTGHQRAREALPLLIHLLQFPRPEVINFSVRPLRFHTP